MRWIYRMKNWPCWLKVCLPLNLIGFILTFGISLLLVLKGDKESAIFISYFILPFTMNIILCVVRIP